MAIETNTAPAQVTPINQAPQLQAFLSTESDNRMGFFTYSQYLKPEHFDAILSHMNSHQDTLVVKQGMGKNNKPYATITSGKGVNLGIVSGPKTAEVVLAIVERKLILHSAQPIEDINAII